MKDIAIKGIFLIRDGIISVILYIMIIVIIKFLELESTND